jgi:predicted dehydrogenase
MDRIRGMTDWRRLLEAQDVDVVDICLPTPQHLEVVTAALASGKHVLCEKPMARTLADGQAIAAAAAKAKGFFMPAMCMRFWGEWEWLKQVVEEKRFGEVRSATFRRAASTPGGWFRDARLSGGAILDLHVHDVDFIYHLFGKPKAVFSRGYSQQTSEIDHIVTQYLYDSPAVVSAEGSWAMADGFGFKMQLAMNFDRATVDFEYGRDNPLMLYQNGKAEPVQTSRHTGYVGEIRYFVDCVKNGTRPTRVTAEDAVMGLRIIEAERHSVQSGKQISV